MLRQLLKNRENWDQPAVINGVHTISYKDIYRKASAISTILEEIQPDGTIIQPDGTIIQPDGAITQPDGTITQPDGTGIRPDHTAILLPDDESFLAAFYGTLMACKTAFPLSIRLTRYEIVPLLIQTSTATLITSTAYRPLVEEITAAMPPTAMLRILWIDEISPQSPQIPDNPASSHVSPTVPSCPDGITPDGTTPHGIIPNGITFAGINPAGITSVGCTPAGCTSAGITPAGRTPAGCTPAGCTSAGITPAGITPDDITTPAVLLPTSGTTGSAKIVQLSERNIDASFQAYIEKMDFEKFHNQNIPIRYLLATPFSSAYGIMITAACLSLSFPIVLLKEDFTLNVFYQTIQDYQVTHYEGGTMTAILMDRMAGRPNPYDISSLKYLGCGGSRVSGETFSRLLKSYPGIEFWAGYGMTEASPLITKPDKKVPPDKLDSAGTPISGLTIKIVTETGLTDTPYQKGEVAVQGPNVMLGYYNNEEATRRVLKHGYLYTGDIGYLDEDGWLYLCGRKKNIIITRGFNIYPEEVEACLMDSRLVKDCLVYGAADSRENEFVCADIIPARPEITEAQIREYVSTRLSAGKRPQKIRLVRELTKTPTGKNRKLDEEPLI